MAIGWKAFNEKKPNEKHFGIILKTQSILWKYKDNDGKSARSVNMNNIVEKKQSQNLTKYENVVIITIVQQGSGNRGRKIYQTRVNTLKLEVSWKQ